MPAPKPTEVTFSGDQVQKAARIFKEAGFLESSEDPAARLAKIQEATQRVKQLKRDVDRLAEQSKYAKEDLKAAQVDLLELGDPKALPLFEDPADDDTED